MTVWYVGHRAHRYHTERDCRIIEDRADDELRTAESADELWRDWPECAVCGGEESSGSNTSSRAYAALSDPETTSLEALRGEEA